MRLWAPFFQILLAVSVLLPFRAHAYTVSPNLLVLRASGAESSGFLQLENKGKKPAAIEITVQEVHKDLDGHPLPGGAADDDFLIYPSQLVLLPGDEAGVQVRWIGAAALAAERTFTLVAREVQIPRKPGEDSEPAAGIRVDITVLMNYEVRIYVAPPGARPKVVVESVAERPPPAAVPGPAEPAQLEIILANQGTAHASMGDMTLLLSPVHPAAAPFPPRTVTLSARDVPAMNKHLLAGERRRLLIPRPAGLPAGPVRVVLSD